VDSKPYRGNGEMNKLRAYIDDLWIAAPVERQRSLAKARGMGVADAWELGSKGKNPAALTFEEAQRAVVATYVVAHALCFSSGFPGNDSTEPASTRG
jgi:hypothetical protein